MRLLLLLRAPAAAAAAVCGPALPSLSAAAAGHRLRSLVMLLPAVFFAFFWLLAAGGAIAVTPTSSFISSSNGRSSTTASTTAYQHRGLQEHPQNDAATTCPCINRQALTVHMISHGDPTQSQLWREVRSGFYEAGKALKVKTSFEYVTAMERLDTYQGSSGKVVSALLNRALTANLDPKSHLFITTIPAGSEDKVLEMRNKGYRLFSINTANTTLALSEMHFGMEDYSTGQSAGVKFAKTEASGAVCVIHDQSDKSLTQRCQGFTDGLLGSCIKGVNCTVETVTVDGSNTYRAKEVLKNLLQTKPSINGILTLSSGMGSAVYDLLQSMGKEKAVKIGTFDLTSETTRLLQDNQLFFVVDQQQFLQGYLSTVLMVIYGTIGERPQIDILTGPKFLSTPPLPRTVTQKDLRLRIVVHGASFDGFWYVYQQGVRMAGNDTGLDFTFCSIVGSTCTGEEPLSYSAPGTEFDMGVMSNLIEKAVQQKPQGLVVSIPNPDGLKDALRNAQASTVPLISANSGYKVGNAIGITVLTHVGQTEYEAGVGAGKLMKSKGIVRPICLIGEAGNTALEERCKGYFDGLQVSESAREIVIVSISNMAVTDAALGALYPNSSQPDGMLLTSASIVPPVLNFLRSNSISGVKIGTFDLSDAVQKAVVDGEILFGINQQQYLQGYIPIVLLQLYALTGLSVLNPLVMTGPAFVASEEQMQTTCTFSPACLARPRDGGVCAFPEWKADGWCDPDNNNEACNWDGGDCCPSTCKSSAHFSCGKDTYDVGWNHFDCRDPSALKRSCKRGQQFMQGICVDCPPGFFGIDGLTCIACFSVNDMLRCEGQDRFFARPGYWVDHKSIEKELLKAELWSLTTADAVTNAADRILTANTYECGLEFCPGQRQPNELELFGTVSGCGLEYTNTSLLCMGCQDGFVKLGPQCQAPEVCTGVEQQAKVLLWVGVALLGFFSILLALLQDANEISGLATLVIYFLQVQFALGQSSPSGRTPVLGILEIFGYDLPPAYNGDYNCGFLGYGTIVSHLVDGALLWIFAALMFPLASGVYYYLVTRHHLRNIGEVVDLMFPQEMTTNARLKLKTVTKASLRDAALELRFWKRRVIQIFIQLMIHILLFPLLRSALQLIVLRDIAGQKVMKLDASITLESSDYRSGRSFAYFLLFLCAAIAGLQMSCGYLWKDHNVSSARPYVIVAGFVKVDRCIVNGYIHVLFDYLKPNMEHWILWKITQNVLVAVILETQTSMMLSSLMLCVLWLFSLISQLRKKPFRDPVDNFTEELLLIMQFFLSSYYIILSLATSSNLDWGTVSMAFIVIVLILFSGLEVEKTSRTGLNKSKRRKNKLNDQVIKNRLKALSGEERRLFFRRLWRQIIRAVIETNREEKEDSG